MSRDWQAFWDEYRKSEPRSDDDLFVQVGKTISSKPIPRTVFEAMIASISRRLSLSPGDMLLDLCCGNGLVTYELAPLVGRVTAVDFARHLIAAAREHKSRANISYRVADVCAPLPVLLGDDSKPNKLLMNDALAYFDPPALSQLLGNVLEHVGDAGFTFLITGIPNEALESNFYDTPERRARRDQNRLVPGNTNDGLGRWWRGDEIEATCRALGLTVVLEDQPALLSNYRMDALVSSP